MTGKRLGEPRERYNVPHHIEMLVPEPNERACYPRPGCVAVSEYLFKTSMRLPLHPFFRAVLRKFMLSPTQVLPNGADPVLRSRESPDLCLCFEIRVFTRLTVEDKFKKREYPAPDMASILKATSTAKARPLKPGSSGAKEVRGRVERLSKDCTPRASEEASTQRPEKPKEPRGKEKVSEETKKRKLVHISSSASKFGTSVSHRAEQTGELKLLAAASKAIKMEMVREVEAKEAREEAARRVAEATEEEAAKEKPALPEEIRGATESFYKFSTERWQLHASSCDATDLIRALVSQSARTFGLALECREALSEFQTRTHASEGKAASLAGEVKVAKAEAEEAKAQRVEEAAKLESTLAQIEALKREVYESQCKVASLTKKVEANLALAGARDANQFLEGQAKWYMNDASVAREEARTAAEEAVKAYIANFHTTEEYKSFSTCWRNFAYAEVLERAEELYPNLDLAQLRSEFVDEVPQTLAEEVQGDEAADAEAPNVEAGETTTDAQVAEPPSAKAPPSSSQA
ncbi:axoneme-associated protein mst101(2)-like [Olea europaea var. sylvestris]|uniref:axoneme-associated protein mst101(2)-like n=1 Tax=Olea europaea var. sylvestris TaxID=158386 RepID=UPI000C1D47CA|nr:axoneme-associated protein mst101(2)-like [Olea europaea var. sylvestris]